MRQLKIFNKILIISLHNSEEIDDKDYFYLAFIKFYKFLMYMVY